MHRRALDMTCVMQDKPNLPHLSLSPLSLLPIVTNMASVLLASSGNCIEAVLDHIVGLVRR